MKSSMGLKPCPFCGGEAEIQITGRHKDNGLYPKVLEGHVWCTDCNMKMGETKRLLNKECIALSTPETFKDALHNFELDLAELWNKRPRPVRLTGCDFPERCGTCRYFDDTAYPDEGAGACLHTPPTHMTKGFRGIFPRMDTNDWCGGWKTINDD